MRKRRAGAAEVRERAAGTVEARRAILLTIGCLLAVAFLAGCSALKFNPGASPVPSSTAGAASAAAAGGSAAAAQLAQAQRTHEYPAPTEAQTVQGAAAGPLEALRAFAAAYVNWTADTVSGTMRTLAASSVGQARSAMTLAAGQTAQDYELRRGGIANAGTVEAIAPVAGRSDGYAVVTRERTTAAATTAYSGLRPAWHLTLATVTELAKGRWVVSSWQPEN